MFRNYIKTSLRSLKKNILFSSINIGGLAISMSVGVLMILLISELYSFDDFHVRKDNIYRVTTTKTVVLEEDRNYASASIYIGNQIEEQVPAAEKTLIMRRIESADLKAEEGAIAINGFYVSKIGRAHV